MGSKNESENVDQQKLNALFGAIANENLDQVQKLIDSGTDPNWSDDWRGWTPLLCATENQRHEIIKYLIMKGADINKPCLTGFTPLHMAVDIAIDQTIQSGGKQGDEPTADILFLISAGANLNVTDQEGMTPLGIAKKYQSKKVVQLLKGYESLNSSDLKIKLSDWTDWDVAASYLADQLGVFQNNSTDSLDHKSILWTDNRVGNSLHEILNQLTEIGRLEKRDEPDIQYRWNKDFSIDDSNQT